MAAMRAAVAASTNEAACLLWAGPHDADELDEPDGQGGLPVVDMVDDGEIADLKELDHDEGHDMDL